MFDTVSKHAAVPSLAKHLYPVFVVSERDREVMESGLDLARRFQRPLPVAPNGEGPENTFLWRCSERSGLAFVLEAAP